MCVCACVRACVCVCVNCTPTAFLSRTLLQEVFRAGKKKFCSESTSEVWYIVDEALSGVYNVIGLFIL